MTQPDTAAVHLSCDASAFTAEMERLRDQTEDAAHLAAFRAGVGRTPEPSPERTARLAELAATHHGERARRPRWEGFVEVCNTCDRRAIWPFCEHKTDDGKWCRLIRVREVGRGR